MADPSDNELEFLLATDRSALVPWVERVLRDAGVPFQSGLVSGPNPRVVFLVPRARVDEAREVLRRYRRGRALALDDGFFTESEAVEREKAPAFPWGPVQAVSAVILLHLGIVFGLVGRNPTARVLGELGGLSVGRVAVEPWRLLTSVFLHADPSHALWNGFSLLVFSVPLILGLGYLRTAAVYLVSGICGGLAAQLGAGPGVVIIGSSGAVAGVFGAWLAVTFRKARRENLPRRARIRVFGIALLVIPSLLSPITATGQPVSVAAHLGGLAAGLLAGGLLALYAARAAGATEAS